MVWAADSGILIRYVQPRDPEFALVRTAVRTLRARGDVVAFFPQNAAEFWAVATRPASARGGYGLTPARADARLRLLERAFTVLPDTDSTYPEWRQLVVTCGVSGVQVHDARIAAAMRVHGVSRVLTFNATDFARYPGITAVNPADV